MPVFLMKKIIFCLLFFALCVGASAQLTYTYCPPGNTLPPAYASAMRQILSESGIFPDPIALSGNSELAIAGGGDYIPPGRRPDGKTPSLKREHTGLSMEVQAQGLTCDNCTATHISGSSVTGTPGNPAVILDAPGTFNGYIVLNGACNFTITGTGNYRIDGYANSSISGTGPLTYNAPDAGPDGHLAGVSFKGDKPNTYTGQTIISGGYVVCGKTAGKASIPQDVKISSPDPDTPSHLWCLTDGQLGVVPSVVDFSDAKEFSCLHLNGTAQTVSGIQSNNRNAAVESVENAAYFPAGMTADQLSRNPATLNIDQSPAGGSAPPVSVFGGDGVIRNGLDALPGLVPNPGGSGLIPGGPPVSPALTVNIIGGSQIIENPTENISDVTFNVTPKPGLQGAPPVLELRGMTNSNSNSFFPGTGVVFRGAGGVIKKTGDGTIGTNNSALLLNSGLIWVSEGTLRNEGDNNMYTVGNESNTAVLQLDAPAGNNPSPVFDLWGNVSVFGGLTGGGIVQNSWGAAGSLPGGGYSWLIVGQGLAQNSINIFRGVIRDNSSNGPVSANGAGTGGVALKKVGAGTQFLGNINTYTGPTLVSSGTLKLLWSGLLGTVDPSGKFSTYRGVLDISNADSGNPATFEHNGYGAQVFSGDIASSGTGSVLGAFVQSSSGSTIIDGAKSFTGNVSVTGGFLGGSGDLSKANRITVREGGSIGGGFGKVDAGATLVVTGLNFASPSSKLIVTTISSTDGNPSVLDVRARNSTVSGDGNLTVTAGAFTVDIIGNNQLSGYIIKCANGVRDRLPFPTVRTKNTGKLIFFRWDNTGLYMTVGGNLMCDNCTFTPYGSNTSVTGTPEHPVDILSVPNKIFSGSIVLNGACNFTLFGIGDYRINGPISGTGPLTYNAYHSSGGISAGVSLEGTESNTYTGQTVISGGYVICNKRAGQASIPYDVKISATDPSIPSHLWCRTDGQLGLAPSVVDFSDAK